MMVIKFRSSDDHKDLLHKVKTMKEFTEELEDMLEECYEEEEYPEYRGGMYRKEHWEEEPHYRGGRYGYRMGGRG